MISISSYGTILIISLVEVIHSLPYDLYYLPDISYYYTILFVVIAPPVLGK